MQLNKDQLKKVFSNLTELKKRVDDTEYYAFGSTINQSQEYKDLLFKTGFEIRDSYYNMLDSLKHMVLDNLDNIIDNFEEGIDLQTFFSSLFVDSDIFRRYTEADIYTNDLYKWLGENISNSEYVDYAVHEFGYKDLYSNVASGQATWKDEFCFNIFQPLFVKMLENSIEEVA